MAPWCTYDYLNPEVQTHTHRAVPGTERSWRNAGGMRGGVVDQCKVEACFLKYTPCEEYMAPAFHCLSHNEYFEGDCRGGRAVELRWSRERAWRREWQPIPVFLPRKSYGQKNLAGYSPWGRKESNMTLTHAHTGRGL